jgi:hypothetical protein
MEIKKGSMEYKKYTSFKNILNAILSKQNELYQCKNKDEVLLILDELKYLYSDYKTLMQLYNMNRKDVSKLLIQQVVE